MYSNFLNTYLRCYYSSFVKKKKVSKFNQSHNEWITKGIKVSCKEKKNFLYYVESSIIITSNFILKN